MAFFRDDVYAPVAPPSHFESKKFELRSSQVITECTCIRKNGLQGECFRAECIKKKAGDAGTGNSAKSESQKEMKQPKMQTPQMHGDPGVPIQNIQQQQQQPPQEPLQPVVQNTNAPQNNLRSGSKSQIINSLHSSSKSQLLHQQQQYTQQTSPNDVHQHTEACNPGQNSMTHNQNYQNQTQVNSISSSELKSPKPTQSTTPSSNQNDSQQNTPRQPPQEAAQTVPLQQPTEMQHVPQQAPNNQSNSNAPLEVHEECIDPIQCEMLSTQTPSLKKRSCGLTDTPPNELVEYPSQKHHQKLIDENNFTQRFQDS